MGATSEVRLEVTVCGRKGTGVKKVGNCAVRRLRKTSVSESVPELLKRLHAAEPHRTPLMNQNSAEKKI